MTVKMYAQSGINRSDWNLKMALAGITIMIGGSINRIRLEFKDYLII